MSHDAPQEENVVEMKPEVAKELQDKVQALHSLAAVHHLLNQGRFQGSVAGDVVRACDFISILHQSLLKEALEHPDADKVEKLAEMKKAQA